MIRHAFLGLAATLLLAGCGGPWETEYGAPLSRDATAGWRLVDVQVTVPPELTVSDVNSFAPEADIVWHGDPRGDRRAQVAAILAEGIRRGADDLPGDHPVLIAATLQQFHGVTPRSVADAPSAVHNIAFAAAVFDARTGERLTEPRLIRADLRANVGAAAVIAATEGQTQKVRVTRHIERTVQGWLGIGPDIRERFTSLGR